MGSGSSISQCESPAANAEQVEGFPVMETESNFFFMTVPKFKKSQSFSTLETVNTNPTLTSGLSDAILRDFSNYEMTLTQLGLSPEEVTTLMMKRLEKCMGKDKFDLMISESEKEMSKL
jgi:hypothetical protein